MNGVAEPTAFVFDPRFVHPETPADHHQSYSAFFSNREAVRRHLVNSRLRAYFQPIVDFANPRQIHLEVLLRVVSDDGILLSPVDLVKASENLGLINSLTRRIMLAALVDIGPFAHDRLNLSLNISPLSLLSATLPSWLEKVSRRHGFQPRNITLEITEGMRIDGPLAALYLAGVERFRDRGFSIAIDDFGQGYSNLSKILMLNPRYLKLDREFLIEVPHNDKAVAIVESVAYLCGRMGIQLIAEGLENDTQLQKLVKIGCHAFQGYHLSRPLPVSELIRHPIFKNSLWDGYAPHPLHFGKNAGVSE